MDFQPWTSEPPLNPLARDLTRLAEVVNFNAYQMKDMFEQMFAHFGEHCQRLEALEERLRVTQSYIQELRKPQG